ncbi:MAG: bifunctional serine/threonine-protein kinase/formylglycine-generating enzyme family protein [Planctomycetes bacterium]|nr:bifunctional serine/threonine-protein kinase/formylglycine-generating enzyme family protein [Planctomycetota bacterium]
MPSAQGAAQPRIVGGFEILSKIGSGAMGAVFKARQVSMDRVVALKLLPPKIANKDPVFVDRFIREARASAKLNHPNIVQGIEVGKCPETSLYYFAMEYVDGPTVNGLLKKEGAFDERRALEIVLGVAKALVCAERKGIVHRDIKPDNILIDSRGDPKLADLGLAKRVSDNAGGVSMSLPSLGPAANANLTQAGSTVGTPHYMSPEQAEGKAEEVDIRTDLYALGATLYHMVTGRTPYSGNSAVEILVQHLTAPVPDPSAANPDLSRTTCEIIERLMQKAPADRYQNADMLVRELEAALASPLRSGSATTRSRKPVGVKTTGPRQPLGFDTTRKRPGVGGTTGRLAPVGERRAPRAGRAGASGGGNPALMYGAIGGGVLLLLLLLAMGGGSSTPAPSSARRSDSGTPPAGSVEQKTGAILPAVGKPVNSAKTAPVAAVQDPKGAAGPAAAPAFETLQTVAQARWRGAVKALDLSESERVLGLVSDELKLDPAMRSRLAGVLEDELLQRAKALGGEIGQLVQDGKLDQAAGVLGAADASGTLSGPGSCEARKVVSALTAFVDAARQQALPKDPAAFHALLDKVAARLGEQDRDGAARDLASGMAQPELKPWEEALRLQKTALGWLGELDAAILEGAKKLADGRDYELAFEDPKKSAYALGKAPAGKLPMTLREVTADKIALASGGAEFSVRVLELSRTTRRALTALSADGDAKAQAALAVKGAYEDLLRWPTYAGADKAELADVERVLQEARADGAAEELFLPLEPWLARVKAAAAPPPPAVVQAPAKPTTKTLDLGNGVTMELVLVPAGSFQMGTRAGQFLPDPMRDEVGWAFNEMPRHEVVISKPFFIGKYEVTQAQVRVFFPNLPSRAFTGDDMPMHSLNWNMARGFCEVLSRRTGVAARLPTEAEWEYACRAGQDGPFVRWDDPRVDGDRGTWERLNRQAMDAVAWYDENSNQELHAVGQKQPNAWGLYDMLGNVAEFCSDFYGSYSGEKATDPQGPGQGGERIVRGGGPKAPFWRCRPEKRQKATQAERSVGLGLRIVIPADDDGQFARP